MEAPRTFPSLAICGEVGALRVFVEGMKKLKCIADEHRGHFRSEGFVRFFGMLQQELCDEYFGAILDHLRRLEFRDGVLVSAELGEGNKGINYVLRTPSLRESERITHTSDGSGPVYGFEVNKRDDGGARALSELRDRSVARVASTLIPSTKDILGFFQALKTEAGFYVGCLNLRDKLARRGKPICTPLLSAVDQPLLDARGLFDPCLALRLESNAIGNDVVAADKKFVIVTGVNQGGKSTFLRSLGTAQLMMQCCMFVAANRFSANISTGIFTHFKREEDSAMQSGKLEEELNRMSEIIDRIKPRSLLLCNGSFSSTNEREGSEIGQEVIQALLAAGVRVFLVTHLFKLANAYHSWDATDVLFLRAERKEDGQRPFRIIEGEPLPTTYGQDLYEQSKAADKTVKVPSLGFTS